MSVVAENGQTVTDEMLDGWCAALDRDEWPDGWHNVGKVVDGHLPQVVPSTEVLSFKIPSGMKRAIERRAKSEGVSTSSCARELLASSLMAVS